MRISDWSSDVCSSDLQTSESWRIATRLLDVLGSHRVTAYSTRLFGRPVEMLPANGPTNLEAARHFVDLANELDQELRSAEASYVLPAEQVQHELQQAIRSEEHTSELQSLMRISYAVFCLKKKKTT